MARSMSTFEHARVSAWVREYPRMAERFADSDGRPPQHTFFFPEEGYRPELLDKLAELCHRGFGDVEVHLHHDLDTADALRDRLGRFTETLFHKHGLLHRRRDGAITFGFVHGNWALDNARPDGKWCGVNNEITVLLEAGCYADFTLPAAPDASQTRTINSIYYAIDDPLRPRSHESGVRARVGVTRAGQRLADPPGAAHVRHAKAHLVGSAGARERRSRRYTGSSPDRRPLRGLG